MVQRAGDGTVRGSRSPVEVEVVEVVVAVAVVAGLGLSWDRVVPLLGHRLVRRLLRTWWAVGVEEHPRADGRLGVSLRLLRLAPVAHSVSDAGVELD
jgi:hypothetical protein